MTEQERETVIKEARMAAVGDVMQAFARMAEEQDTRDKDAARLAHFASHYLGLRLGEIARGTGRTGGGSETPP